jgi:hypothetical protein
VAALPDFSVQLYSVRGPFARDPGGTLARLAEIGFRRVEPFQLLEQAAALEGTLADSGLSAPTTHAHLVGVQDVAEVFEAAVALGIGTVVEPMVAPERWTSRAGVEEPVLEFDAYAGDIFEGLALSYEYASGLEPAG